MGACHGTNHHTPCPTQMPAGTPESPILTEMQSAERLSAVVVGLFAVLVFLLAACGNDLKTVHGVITDVQARSLTEVATFSVQDSTGRSWSFETEGPINFTPSHIREHALMGQPVTVYYQAEGERLLAQRITD